MNNYDGNNYLDQSREIKLFYKEYVGEPLLTPIITYDRMKDYYPSEVIDLRCQVDHISSKKIRFFQEYDDNPVNSFLYIISLKLREIKLISDGSKFISVEIV